MFHEKDVENTLKTLLCFLNIMSSQSEHNMDELLVYGYIRDIESKYTFYLNISDGLTKIIYNFHDKIFDMLYLCKNHPNANNYNIPYVFKSRIENEITSYVGCEKYEIINDNQIKIYLPYVYILQTKQWYRTHGGTSTNVNGKKACNHIAYILKLEYITITPGGVYGQRFSDEATKKLPQMYYSGYRDGGSIEKPKLILTYMPKGRSSNDLPWFILQTKKRMLVVK